MHRASSLLTFVLFSALVVVGFAWESTLYKSSTWTPGTKDSQGRFLHDFSYAGYAKGEQPIPTSVTGQTVDVTTKGADKTGVADSTAAIQAAINQVGQAGGGTVYLPAGNYSITASSTASAALTINYKNVLLKGAGRTRTFITVKSTFMRNKVAILVKPPTAATWHGTLTSSSKITVDILSPTKAIPVQNASLFAIGDWVVVRDDVTSAWIADHNASTFWDTSLRGSLHYRQITNIVGNTLYIDIPTRYYLKMRDNSRVGKVGTHLTGVGMQDFAIGNVKNSKTGWGDADFDKSGTGAYDVHNSHLIQFYNARDCWMNRVDTFEPKGNAGIHLLSNGVLLYQSRGVTVQDCKWGKPQYLGEGGNGYSFTFQSSDCLITKSVSSNARHPYDFKMLWTTGNVVHSSTANPARLSSDFHMYMSCCNLFDNMTMNGNYLEATFRPYGGSTVQHGHSTTQSVFWNTNGLKYPSGKTYIVMSRQYKWGYVVGTRGAATGVLTSSPVVSGIDTSPQDFVEGVGLGSTLVPQSLYLDQLNKRKATL